MTINSEFPQVVDFTNITASLTRKLVREWLKIGNSTCGSICIWPRFKSTSGHPIQTKTCFGPRARLWVETQQALTLVPPSLLLNRTETLATQATKPLPLNCLYYARSEFISAREYRKLTLVYPPPSPPNWYAPFVVGPFTVPVNKKLYRLQAPSNTPAGIPLSWSHIGMCRPQRVWFLLHFGLKTGIDFAHSILVWDRVLLSRKLREWMNVL